MTHLQIPGQQVGGFMIISVIGIQYGRSNKMTRENLLQAIYDNTDDWSCQSDCPHTKEAENGKTSNN